MDEKRNKYILVEEFSILLKKIPQEYSNLKGAMILIYEQGYKIPEALKESRWNLSYRQAQNIIKKYSCGKINFMDLRRSYIFSNPEEIYLRGRINRKIKPIGLRLRWKVLCRDNFRCIACGRGSKEEILHVDHKIPKSLGGGNELSNLRTLCGDCNMGRGNLIIDLNEDMILKI